MTEAARRLRRDVIAESAQITGPVLATVDRADLEHHHPDAGGDHRGGSGRCSVRRRADDDAETARHRGPARHGSGDADLTIMLAAHRAFRRDLTRLARAASGGGGLAERGGPAPVGRGLLGNGSKTNCTCTTPPRTRSSGWPCRPRLAHSEHALSVLGAMAEEHSRIDPLLAAVDAAFAAAPEASDWPGEDRLAGVIDALASTLTGHLAHEERDGLPLIGVALTAAEWRRRRLPHRAPERPGRAAAEMFAWILDGAGRADAAATLGRAPAPAAPALPRRLEAPASSTPRAGRKPPRVPLRDSVIVPRSSHRRQDEGQDYDDDDGYPESDQHPPDSLGPGDDAVILEAEDGVSFPA